MTSIGNIDSVLGGPTATGNTPKTRASEKRPAKGDSVDLSTDAHRAMEVYKILSNSPVADESRHVLIEAARQRLASGDYKNPGIVQQVAARISSYL